MRLLKKLIVPAFTAVMLSGCLQVDMGIALEEDLSGTAEFRIGIDTWQIAEMVAEMQKTFTGDTTPLSEEDIEVLHQELLAEMDSDGSMSADGIRDEFGPFPEGMTLTHANTEDDGRSKVVSFGVAFDNVHLLNQEPEPEPNPKNPKGARPAPGSSGAPMGDLEIIESDGELILRLPDFNPTDEMQAEMGPMFAQAMMEGLFETMEIRFSIQAPFDVIEHNADEVDGDKLTWVFGFSTMMSGNNGVEVRYRR